MNTCDHYNYMKTKTWVESLKNVFANMCLRSLQLIWRPGFTTAVCESWNVSDNTRGIMLEILNSYPWTRLSVRMIGAIKSQFFHIVAYVFDNSNLSQEIFAIDTWGAVICFLGHGRKHMLTMLPAIWRRVLIHIMSRSGVRVLNS